MQIWRGFSAREDYDHDYGYDHLWIWSPKSCAMHPFWAEQTATFEITDVEFFNFNYSNYHDYDVGINIRVELFDSNRKLERDYEELEDVEFNGR